jgi:transposase
MSQHSRFDASRSLTALEQHSTIIAVIEMSQTKWLVAALVPGVERQPVKKFDAHEETLLKLLHRWRQEAGQAGRNIKRIVVAFEAGRDGFWLARWLRARDVEAYVIHPTSIAVSREHRRAKTDRLDTELLMRVFLGWLRGEKRHCSMVAIPTIEEEDARRPNRERQNLVTEQTRIINQIKAILPASAFAACARPCASLPKGSKICARRKARHCHRTRFRSCAVISRGYPSYATRSARSNRNACASSRWLLKARTRWSA